MEKERERQKEEEGEKEEEGREGKGGAEEVWQQPGETGFIFIFFAF